jgi:hypothetical protein
MKHISYWLLAVGLICAMPMNGAKRRVFTIGDSAMSDYKPSETPKRGW